MTRPTLTTTAGNPIADNQNSLTAGERGPVLMQDYQLIEKLAHHRGLIIQDGNNIPPGTPIENINAMTEAAERYGRYE